MSGSSSHFVTWLGLTLVWRFCANYGIDFSPQFYFIKNPDNNVRIFISLRDLAGARTQDPLLKREMLYQLSYQVNM